jgi:hypothetical protein
MPKVKVRIGYTDYMMDEEPAFALFKALNGPTVERLEATYDSATKHSGHKLIEQDAGFVTLHSVSKAEYAIWKLAGAST